MKTIILIIASLTLALTLSAQNDHFTVRVDGLGCPFCAYGLEKKFKEVKEISDIEVNLEKGILTYRVPSSQQMEFAEVKKLVDDAGYTPISISVERGDGTVEKEDVNSKPNKDSNMEEKTIGVLGNCGMCKDRIEKAANGVRGIQRAEWSVADQTLKVVYDAEKTSIDAIHKAVAAAGHDTDKVKAPNKVYNNLHQCCKYDRVN
nr:heavy-metal-associated domain-containing protein [Saprospiraceae bacterium]